MFSLRSLLRNIGHGLLEFMEALAEFYSRPTPCDRCQQEYPHYRLVAHQVSDPYGVLDRHYYPLCFSCSQELKAIVEERVRPLLRDARIYAQMAYQCETDEKIRCTI